MIGTTMKPGDFLGRYEAALATQDWQFVSPLIHDDACVTFSNGDHFKGKAEVQKAFERNFRAIQEEDYTLFDLHWVRQGDQYAVCTYGFRWQGLIQGELARGSGRGTAVLVKENECWLLLAEHLSPGG